ncbi:MAG: hypothetical protein ACREAM_09045 [Blastocatellia bacterium]
MNSRYLMLVLAVLCVITAWIVKRTWNHPEQSSAQQPDKLSGVGASLDVERVPASRNAQGRLLFPVKFLCGGIKSDPAMPEFGDPLSPGTYLTAINIHNPNQNVVRFRKKALITNPQGQPQGIVGRFVHESLEPNAGLEVDCKNIIELLGGNISFPKEFTKGFVVIETIPSTPFLDVVAVYTYKNIEPRPR